jgi:hypothetical protein
MSKLVKALERLQSKPRDFSWNELTSLMESFGYELKTTGGSSRKFIHVETRATLFIHEPHPQNVLKAYQVRDVLQFMKQEKHIP